MRTRRRFGAVVLGLAALVLLVGGVRPVRADVMTPPGLTPGQQFRIVFVTTTTTQATSSSISTYDNIVATDAVSGGLGTYAGQPVMWEAIATTYDPTTNPTGVTAVSRLPTDGVPIYLPTGLEVATGGAALWNTTNHDLQNPIDETANGTTPIDLPTWTGTGPTGLTSPTGPLGSTGMPATGFFEDKTTGWVDSSPADPIDPFPLYGFSSVLTVPAAAPPAVPEPGSLTLVLVGLGGLVGARRWRRWREASARPASSPSPLVTHRQDSPGRLAAVAEAVSNGVGTPTRESL